MTERAPEGYYAGNVKIPQEVVERDNLVTLGMKLPGQGVLTMLMPDGSIAQITFRASSKKELMQAMESAADVALFKDGPFLEKTNDR